MKLSFESGVVIVVGGSGGIGEQIARAFASEGLPVAITYNANGTKASAVKASIAAEGGTCDCHQVDLANSQQVAHLFEAVASKMGAIGHVIYAAGPHFSFEFIGRIPDAEWSRVIDADVKGGFHVIQNAVKAFRSQRSSGSIVAITTAAVERVPVKDILSAAPKAAVEMLVRGVAKEAGRYGIRANCIAPGWINVGIGKRGLEEKLDEAAREQIRTQSIPLQRIGAADDIVNAALFMSSREGSYITGQSLAIDGGLQL